MSKKTTLHWTPFEIRLGDLDLNKHNPKTSDDATVARLNDSLDTLGEFQELLCDSDQKSLIDGHQRVNAWIVEKGEDYIAKGKYASRKLTKREIEKIIFYTGKGTLGDFDKDMLAENFSLESAIELGGFTEAELAGAYDLDFEKGTPEAPDDFKEVGDNSLDHQCPRCKFEFD